MSTPEDQREALRRWFDAKGTNANAVATKGGFSASAIYNFLDGRTKSLSSGVLSKMSALTGSTINEILGVESGVTERVPADYIVGAKGKMYEADEVRLIAWPPGVARDDGIAVAVIAADGLHPLPADWAVFWRREPEEPARLLGQLAVVQVAGSDAPWVRLIGRGSDRGLFNLDSWNSARIEDAEVLAAHRIVALAPSRPA